MQNVYTRKNDATKSAEEAIYEIQGAIADYEDMLSEQKDHIRDELVDMLIKDGTLPGHSSRYEIIELDIRCGKSPINICVFDSEVKNSECHFCHSLYFGIDPE